MVTNIQVLRAFAALAVVWRHMTLWFGVDPGFGLMHAGRAGVDVFFVISGFIMFHTTRNNDRSPLAFWTDRAIRIAPLYWLMTGITLALFYAGLPADQVKAVKPADIATDLAFIPGVRADSDWNPIVSVGWSLTYEAYFYAVMGLALFLRTPLMRLIALTILFIVTGLLSQGGHLPFALFRWWQPISLEFAAGGALALLFGSDFAMPRLVARIAAPILIAFALAVIVAASMAFGEAIADPTPLRTLLFGPPAVAIVAAGLMLEKSGVLWNSRTLLLLGAASYSIYLGQPLVLQYSALAWKALGGNATLLPVFAIASMLLCVAAGLALHRIFERPSHVWLKARLRRPLARAAA